MDHDERWLLDQGLISSSTVVSSGSTVHYYFNFTLKKLQKPILVLLHGYPQTSYMWRYAADHLSSDIPIFMPDLPGYGRSSPAGKHDKRVIGESVMEALAIELEHYGGTDKFSRRVILAGHDRGARVAHRLAVDICNGSAKVWGLPIGTMFEPTGLIIMDILPTAEQWKIFGATPKNMTRSFHWSFLANVDLATEMIKSFGGGKWCTEMMKRWSGSDEEGQSALQGGHSFQVYSKFFEQESVIRATSEDYRAGAEEDVTEQEENQELGRQVRVPALVLYSSDYSGKRYGPQMKQIWSWWMLHPHELTVEEIANSGHFIAEEQPRQTYEAVGRFYERVQASQVAM